ncbi:GntR family transcriptional regulator [Candidatus Leptofilum sp.]|uniref:GntR family transcriptional regulator n=1 Tax=Candidatus Leptofilum sp. TaxID=3241576 RepID=UPI003B596B91
MLTTSHLPKYFQVAAQLRHKITIGDFRQNDQLPTEGRLMQTFGVSRGTVRKALAVLLNEGLVESQQGLGTFVKTAVHTTNHFSLMSFNEEMHRQGRTPTTQLLQNERLLADTALAARLEIDVGEPVRHIERLRLADGELVAHEHRYFAESLCPGLATDDLENQSIHWLLTQKFQIPLVKVVHVVARRPLTPEQATLLETAVDTIAFQVDRLSYTSQNEQTIPAVLFQAAYRADNFYLHAKI